MDSVETSSPETSTRSAPVAAIARLASDGADEEVITMGATSVSVKMRACGSMAAEAVTTTITGSGDIPCDTRCARAAGFSLAPP